jgi:nitrogen fixation/metabolism regulation signal transduction histidine kinase
MNFNNFQVRIVAYVLLITLTSMGLVWSLHQEYMVATSSGLGLLLILETIGLIRFINKVKRDLQRFIDAVKNQDTTLAFPLNRKDTFMRELHEGFNEIITGFRLVRREKELEHHFFQNTIQHVPIGLIAFNRKGEVKLQNNAMTLMFDTEPIKNIQKLGEKEKNIPDRLHSMKNGEESLLKLLIGGSLKNISVKVSEIKLEQEKLKIASFQDISREIDRSEVEAWQKLIRVLRHEIMNSISPIRIMSGNLLHMVSEKKKEALMDEEDDQKLMEDLEKGLQIIRKRSTGLGKFVESYRHLTKIPEPRFTEIKVKALFDQVIRLFREQQPEGRVEFNSRVEPEGLKIPGDEKLLEQVLINLVKNAVESIQEQKEGLIELIAYKNENQTHIRIRDNGTGIPEDQLGSIFIPFYTTKEGGSGIGLSLSRQIIQIHNGSIQIYSKDKEGTEVLVTL